MLAETEFRTSKVNWGQRGPLWLETGDKLKEQLGNKSRMVGWSDTEEDLGRQDKDLEFVQVFKPGATCTKQ